MQNKPPKLAILHGPMWSGKSDALISILLGHQGPVVAARPIRDTRDPGDRIISRTGAQMHAYRFESPGDLLYRLEHRGRFEIVAIDEAQMMDPEELLSLVTSLMTMGSHVLVVGLMHDYKREPWPSMVLIAKYASASISLRSQCARCGALTSHTARLTGEEARIIPGDRGYEPRCDACWEVTS